MSDDIRISAEGVKTRLDRGERVVFVDSRNPQAWGSASVKLRGAVRVPADEADKHIHDVPEGALIAAYCT